MNPEDEPTPDELEEASRLAEALEGRRSLEGPEEALESAALLRHAAGGFDLAAEERDRVIEQALSEARPPERVATSWWERLGVKPWLLAAALGATAVLLLVLRTEPEATALPAPPPALLRAQAEVAVGGGPEPLGREMDAYRAQVYAALSRRYR